MYNFGYVQESQENLDQSLDTAYERYVERLKGKGKGSKTTDQPTTEYEARERYIQRLQGKGNAVKESPSMTEENSRQTYIQRLQGKGTRGDSVTPSGIYTDDHGRTFHTDDSTHREQAFQNYLAKSKKKTGLLENVPTHQPDPSELGVIERGIFIAL